MKKQHKASNRNLYKVFSTIIYIMSLMSGDIRCDNMDPEVLDNNESRYSDKINHQEVTGKNIPYIAAANFTYAGDEHYYDNSRKKPVKRKRDADHAVSLFGMVTPVWIDDGDWTLVSCYGDGGDPGLVTMEEAIEMYAKLDKGKFKEGIMEIKIPNRYSRLWKNGEYVDTKLNSFYVEGFAKENCMAHVLNSHNIVSDFDYSQKKINEIINNEEKTIEELKYHAGFPKFKGPKKDIHGLGGFNEDEYMFTEKLKEMVNNIKEDHIYNEDKIKEMLEKLFVGNKKGLYKHFEHKKVERYTADKPNSNGEDEQTPAKKEPKANDAYGEIKDILTNLPKEDMVFYRESVKAMKDKPMAVYPDEMFDWEKSLSGSNIWDNRKLVYIKDLVKENIDKIFEEIAKDVYGDSLIEVKPVYEIKTVKEEDKKVKVGKKFLMMKGDEKKEPVKKASWEVGDVEIGDIDLLHYPARVGTEQDDDKTTMHVKLLGKNVEYKGIAEDGAGIPIYSDAAAKRVKRALDGGKISKKKLMETGYKKFIKMGAEVPESLAGNPEGLMEYCLDGVEANRKYTFSAVYEVSYTPKLGEEELKKDMDMVNTKVGIIEEYDEKGLNVVLKSTRDTNKWKMNVYVMSELDFEGNSLTGKMDKDSIKPNVYFADKNGNIAAGSEKVPYYAEVVDEEQALPHEIMFNRPAIEFGKSGPKSWVTNWKKEAIPKIIEKVKNYPTREEIPKEKEGESEINI